MDEKGENAVIDSIQNLPLSDDTIPRRINKISEQIFEQTIFELQQAMSWSFAIDSSSDIKDVENLLIYVSYTIIKFPGAYMGHEWGIYGASAPLNFGMPQNLMPR